MHKPSAEELYPSAFLTDLTSSTITEWTRKIHLYSRLNKWKISRSHTDRNFSTENIGEHRAKGIFEIGEGNVFIDDHSFDLIERIFMSGIDIFITEDSSGDNRFHGNSL